MCSSDGLSVVAVGAGTGVVGCLGWVRASRVGAEVGMFEPVHGSWPEGADQDRANPTAAILSAAMMLDHLGLVKEGDAIRKAVGTVLESGKGTEDLRPKEQVGTDAMGDLIVAAL